MPCYCSPLRRHTIVSELRSRALDDEEDHILKINKSESTIKRIIIVYVIPRYKILRTRQK